MSAETMITGHGARINYACSPLWVGVLGVARGPAGPTEAPTRRRWFPTEEVGRRCEVHSVRKCLALRTERKSLNLQPAEYTRLTGYLAQPTGLPGATDRV